MPVCASCNEQFREGSKYCHVCGALTDPSATITQHEKGRQKLLVVIGVMVAAVIIDRMLNLWANVIAHDLSGEFFVATVINLGFVLLMSVLLYKGIWWIRWLVIALSFAGGLLLFSFLFVYIDILVPAMFFLLAIIQMFCYVTTGVALIRSEDIAVFLKAQEFKRR